MSKRADQSKHDEMIVLLAKHLMANEYAYVRADVEGFEKPNEINFMGDQEAYVPDLTANKGKKFVFEVETEDTIDDEHTENQWKIFAAYGYQNMGIFCVVVPKGSMEKANERLKELGLPGKVIEI